jgi:3-oxoacyl-[acyl-carrier-protein] synthase II
MAAVAGMGCIAGPGRGIAALREGMRARSPRTLGAFDPRDHLAMKGLRPLSRASGLAAVAAADALEGGVRPAACGVVLGTLWASIGPLVEFERTAAQEGPHAVSPSEFANVVVNVHAGYLGILFGLEGPNVTLCGAAAGLEAVGHACDVLALGRADAVLCGGVDDASPAVRSMQEDPGEGAGLLLLTRGTAPATVAGWARDPDAALAAAGLTPSSVDSMWHSDDVAAALGDCRAATGALAAVLAADAAARGDVAVATAPGVAVVFAPPVRPQR